MGGGNGRKLFFSLYFFLMVAVCSTQFEMLTVVLREMDSRIPNEVVKCAPQSMET